MQNPISKIILIGFMGAGKSTIGHLLAEQLRLPLHELDSVIVARSGCASAADIFDRFGEGHFRALETEVAAEHGAVSHGVISCGGGVINRGENIAHLRANGGVVVYLHAPFQKLAARIAASTEERPLFRDTSRAESLYLTRLPLYRAAADIEVVTDERDPHEVVSEIVRLLTVWQRARGSHINGQTALTLIIGDPVAHSLSPRMHNAGYSACGINYVMAASHVTAQQLEQAVAGVRALSIRGLAVTMPHKLAIMSHLDTIDQVAQEIGAVNTVVNDARKLTGYNTDWRGIRDPLIVRTPLAGKRVAVLGAGGAAQAAIYACRHEGAQVTIFNRTAERAATLAERSGCGVGTLDDTAAIHGHDIVINTTSVGMLDSRDETPIACDAIHRGQIVFETIYAPRHTKLVQAALERGACVILGIEMFIAQGVAQFELHTGHTAPAERMREVVG